MYIAPSGRRLPLRQERNVNQGAFNTLDVVQACYPCRNLISVYRFKREVSGYMKQFVNDSDGIALRANNE